MCGTLGVDTLCLYMCGDGISVDYGGVDSVDKCVDGVWRIIVFR